MPNDDGVIQKMRVFRRIDFDLSFRCPAADARAALEPRSTSDEGFLRQDADAHPAASSGARR